MKETLVMKNRGDQKASRNVISQKWTLLLCISSFCAGLLFTNRYVYIYTYMILIVFLQTFEFDHMLFLVC
ncbi:hypothetical protein HanOQP8_Chr04g0168291 [Helianthus annuus]|nr:hypothetical protein HanOQP8_Chr04g0168291 [Helianthus annuus]